MTDVVALVRTRLLALSAVTALVEQRVYSGVLPQNINLPAVAIQTVTRDESSHLRGSSGLLDDVVQVFAVAGTRAAAIALADVIAGTGDGSALSHFRGLVGSVFVKGVLPIPLENETVRAGAVNEFEVMRGYRVMVAR